MSPSASQNAFHCWKYSMGQQNCKSNPSPHVLLLAISLAAIRNMKCIIEKFPTPPHSTASFHTFLSQAVSFRPHHKKDFSPHSIHYFISWFRQMAPKRMGETKSRKLWLLSSSTIWLFLFSFLLPPMWQSKLPLHWQVISSITNNRKKLVRTKDTFCKQKVQFCRRFGPQKWRSHVSYPFTEFQWTQNQARVTQLTKKIALPGMTEEVSGLKINGLL